MLGQRSRIAFLVAAFASFLGGNLYGLVSRKLAADSRSDLSIDSPVAISSDTLQKETLTCRYLDLLVLSDRNNTEVPLRALVNSLLTYTSSPIHLHLVTRATSSTIQWLTELQSLLFRVTLYHPRKLLQRSVNLIRTSSLKLVHPSSKFAIQKLYLPEIPLRLFPCVSRRSVGLGYRVLVQWLRCVSFRSVIISFIVWSLLMSFSRRVVQPPCAVSFAHDTIVPILGPSLIRNRRLPPDWCMPSQHGSATRYPDKSNEYSALNARIRIGSNIRSN